MKAIVAWDNLGPAEPTSGGGRLGEQPCPADPDARRPVPLTKPALGMSADYGIVPTPYTSAPDIDGFACEDLRAGCPGMAPDGGGPYGYYDLALGK